MFGFIADFIASITTILLPIYLSYKSLRTSDPAQTTPWLIYFLTLALFLLFESWTLFIISWIPFYSWLRLFFLLYLVLPQTQGAKLIYLNYFEPYIVQHERQIDELIGQAHEQLQSMGLGYLNILVEYIRDKILGQKPPEPTPHRAPPGPGNYASYASDLLSRFAMPAARTSAMTATSNIYSTLSSALSSVPNPSAFGQASRSLQSQSPAEKASYLASQREQLTSLLRAIDKEQQTLDLAYGSEPGVSHVTSGGAGHSRKPSGTSRPPSSGSGLGMSKSRSELSFDTISREEVHNGGGQPEHISWDQKVSSAAASPPPRLPIINRENTGWLGAWFSGGGGGSGGVTPTGAESGGNGHSRGAGSGGSHSERQGKGQSTGWSKATDVTEAIAEVEAMWQGQGKEGSSSGVDYR